mmetsp:Transcript_102775/g.125629  ORF Transcript_102775/g.125629 Transcript_102775/m.125629 type:complete len:218 (+) Transcript_102775:93-746(+)
MTSQYQRLIKRVLLRTNLGEFTYNVSALKHSIIDPTFNCDSIIKDYINALDKHNNIITPDGASLPPRFFAYGTLRDDDNSNAPWTKEWTNNCNSIPAFIKGFKLYQHCDESFPFAIRSYNNNDIIKGRLIYWNNIYEFIDKLKMADEIEEYTPNNIHSMYIRNVVNITLNNNETIDAIMYYQRYGHTNIKLCKQISNGEWLDRKYYDWAHGDDVELE